LGSANILSVVKVQNKVLYDNYNYSKNQISEKYDIPTDDVIEKILFFSTDKVLLTTLCESDKNIDLSLKQVNGKWGPALYFYESAFECEKAFIGKSADGASKQMILAAVILGNCKATQPDPSMRQPPVIEGRNARRYDSVQGNLGNSSCFVIYNEGRVYPQYLITY
jgi:hypothetical protein